MERKLAERHVQQKVVKHNAVGTAAWLAGPREHNLMTRWRWTAEELKRHMWACQSGCEQLGAVHELLLRLQGSLHRDLSVDPHGTECYRQDWCPGKSSPRLLK